MTAVSLHALPDLFPVCELRIPLGPAAGQIGVEKGDGEHWKPLFFSADADGNLYVPDFYKGRIAVFDARGAFRRAIPTAHGISPRMNYFTRTPEGLFVTFDGFTLFCLEPSGALRWTYRFPFGTIPQAVHVTDAGVFIVLPSPEDRGAVSVVFGWNEGKLLGVLSRKTDGISVPIITAAGGTVFSPALSDTAQARTDGFTPDTALPGDLTLVSILPDGTSVWRSDSARDSFYLLDRDGNLISEGTVPAGADRDGSFWTFVSETGSIWKNSFTEDTAVYTEYGFR